MADINHIISLGIGSPAAIQEFLTFGLQQGASTTVPNVVGETEAQATTDIQAVGLTISVTYAYDAVVAIGLVVSQLPVGGSNVTPGSNVAVVVSLGPQPVGGSNPGGGGGGNVWSSKFEFTKQKRKKKALPVSEPQEELKPERIEAITVAEPEPIPLVLIDEDEEAITAILEAERKMILNYLARLKL